MARIITDEMIHQAIELTRPTAEAILKIEGATWGPKMIIGWVRFPDIKTSISFFISLHDDKNEPWNSEWGVPEKFSHIAMKKLKVVMREKVNSSIIAKLKPWLLEEEEYMYAGGAYSDEIGVTAS